MGLGRLEAEGRVVVGVPDDDHERKRCLAGASEAVPEQARPDALALPLGRDRHRCESEDFVATLESCPTEEQMADDLTNMERNKAKTRDVRVGGAKGVDEVRFCAGGTEGLLKNAAHTGVVLAGLWTDLEHATVEHCHSHDATSSPRSTELWRPQNASHNNRPRR